MPLEDPYLSPPMRPTYLNKMVALVAPISRCWTVSGGFFCCHLSLHSCTLESVKNLQKKYERKFAGISIGRWQKKRRRHSHLKTLSNAPAGTSTSLGDQATSMFTAGTVTETIPSLSVSALGPWVLQARLLTSNCLFSKRKSWSSSLRSNSYGYRNTTPS